MEPTLPKGSIVWVDDDVSSIDTGDVVLIEGESTRIIHRLVHRTTGGGADRIYHRGDLEGGIGITTGSAIRGRVVAIMEPERAQIPRLRDLSVEFQRRFRSAEIRCRLHAICTSAATRLRLDRIGWIRSLGRVIRERLL